MINPVRKPEITAIRTIAGAGTTIWELRQRAEAQADVIKKMIGLGIGVGIGSGLTFLVTKPRTPIGFTGSPQAVDLELHNILAGRWWPPLAVEEPSDHQHLNPSTNPGEPENTQGDQEEPTKKGPTGLGLELKPDPGGEAEINQLAPAEPVEIHPGRENQEQHHPYGRGGIQKAPQHFDQGFLDLGGAGGRDLGGLNREREGHRTGERGRAGRRGRRHGEGRGRDVREGVERGGRESWSKLVSENHKIQNMDDHDSWAYNTATKYGYSRDKR